MTGCIARVVLRFVLAMLAMVQAPYAAADPRLPRVVGDGIPQPLAAMGDVARGRTLLVARENANCVLCHAIPDPTLRFAGDVGPSLAGVAARLTPAQLRLRIADNLRVNAATVMPSYYRTEGLHRVAAPYRDRTILTAQEVEDLVAFLGTLR